MRLAGFTPPADQPVLVVRYEGEQDAVSAGCQTLEVVQQRWRARRLPLEQAEQEWDERLYNLRVKRMGPTLLGAESWLPLENLCDYAREVAQLSQRQKTGLATYANIVTPTQAAVMTVYPSNERHTLRYILDLSLTNRLYRIAFRHSGRPYGIGFWNTPYLPWSGEKAIRQERLRRKKQLDANHIMNPGKVYAPPIIFSPAIFNLAMGSLATLRAALRMGAWSHSTTDYCMKV